MVCFTGALVLLLVLDASSGLQLAGTLGAGSCSGL